MKPDTATSSIRLILISSVVIVFCLRETNAQWIQTEGPCGGPISSLTIVGETVLAGTFSNGVFLTATIGATWKTANNGLTDLGIKSLVSHGNTVCAVAGNHVFLSSDGGRQWEKFDTGLPDKQVACLEFCGNKIIAGTLGAGLFLSTITAADWKPINAKFIESKSIYSIAVMGDTIFAGSDGIYKSVDFGVNWTQINPSYYAQERINALAVTDNAIYAGTDVGVIFTRSGGAAWSKSPGRYIQTIAAFNGSVYAGSNSDTLISSADNGVTWSAVNAAGSGGINALSALGTTLWAGTLCCGVITSADGGIHWTAITAGMRNTTAASLAVNGNALFAATSADGVFYSTDRGTHWIPINSGLSNRAPTSLLVYNNKILAGTAAGIFSSADGGSNWTFSARFSTYPILSLGKGGNGLFAGTYREGAFLSTNEGATWQPVLPVQSETHVYAFAESNGNVFAGTSEGVFHISGGTASWAAVNSGLPSNSFVQSIAANGNDLFAGITHMGIFRSSDNGASWTAVNSGLDLNTVFTSIITGSGNIIAATKDRGIFLSADRGTSWKSADAGLENSSIYSLLIDGPDIFAGTGSGVWRRPVSELTGETKSLRIPEISRQIKFTVRLTHLQTGSITIEIALPRAQRISIAAYDLCGRKIATLADTYFNAGFYHFPWNIRNVPPGCYSLALKTGSEGMVRRITVF